MGAEILIVFIYFTIWYIASIVMHNTSIIDIGWGLGFVVLALYGYISNPSVAGFIVTMLVTIWGLRLSISIFKRNYKKPEDFRYANFRKAWGKIFLVRAYFQLFLFQGVIMILISMPFIFINKGYEIRNWYVAILGVIIWLVGFFFEVVADYQLKKFIQNINNRGKLLTSGLFKYTRHPNYFGEAVMWWGIYIFALGSAVSWLTIISPITITLIIRFVSGVPLLEASLKNKPGFKEYKEKTNAFIPWVPKQ